MKRWIGILVVVSGCMVGPNYRTPETPTPKGWSSIDKKPTTQTAATQPSVPTTQPARVDTWWTTLGDPELESLLNRAVASNLNLQIAVARVRQARAQRSIAVSGFFPQVNLNDSYRYSGASLNTGPKTPKQSFGRKVRNAAVAGVLEGVTNPAQAAATTVDIPGILGQSVSNTINKRLATSGLSTPRDANLFLAGFDASWELDVFGGVRRSVEAAEADLAATIEDQRNVLISLLAEVAINYTDLRGFQRRLEIAQKNIRSQRDTLEVTQERARVGLAPPLDVAQAQAQLASTESTVPLFETSIRQTIYQLSVLLGEPPGALLAELQVKKPIPVIPPVVPVGLPSDLLRRRPDIRFAERQLAAATARIGVAEADLYPRFTINGSFGSATRDIRHLLDEKSFTWAVGPGMNWPIFEGGRIYANIEVQNAITQQALANYEQTVLAAFQDVESSLVAYQNEQVRYRSLTTAVKASRTSVELSNELYSRGLTAFLNVLESQRALYATEDQMIQSETTAVTNLISLYKALGGGWNPED